MDSIRFGPGAPGVERAEVHLSATRFEPHRHDTYAIGVTTAGVQTFRYRGAARVCLPGQLHVLHPDELHDGAAGTDDGFGYRILYVAPELVRGALGDRPLPFVRDPVQDAAPPTARLLDLLRDLDDPMGDLRATDVAVTVADTLLALAGSSPGRTGRVDVAAMSAVRDYLDAHAAAQTPSSALERVAGLDRFAVARQFRRAFGTSPDRYRTLRRLERARALLETGTPIADAAAVAGFADQSHLTRQFRRAFGMTPARWRALVRGAAQPF